MIIWSGRGFLVPVVGFGVLILVQAGVDELLGEGYYQSHEWAQNLAVVLAAVAVSVLGGWLNRKRELLLDEDTGESLILKSKHTLFFIPAQYWGIVILAVWILATYV